MDDFGAFFEMDCAAGTADDAVLISVAAPARSRVVRRIVRRIQIARVIEPIRRWAWLQPLRTGPPALAFN